MYHPRIPVGQIEWHDYRHASHVQTHDMDISMPEMDGIEATRQIKTQWPEVCVIGLSMMEDDHLVHAMRKAGAENFLTKTASMAELLTAIYGVDERLAEDGPLS